MALAAKVSPCGRFVSVWFLALLAQRTWYSP